MPWKDVKLNDGRSIPTIAFGSWTAGSGDIVTQRVNQALETGFNHLDTAQSYRNEADVGRAIRESGLKRDELFVTTKFSGLKDVETSIDDSLKNLGLSYVDLYLVHHPRLAGGDIPGLWAKVQKIQADGKAKSIGVSNFEIDDLKQLADAKVKPAVNQILFHPYVWKKQAPLHAFGNAMGIVTEAYSALTPITNQPGGPLDEPLDEISSRLNATPDQVLLAWVKAKGAVAVTYSSKAARLDGYQKAGDLDLSVADVAMLDAAGAKKSDCALMLLQRSATARFAGLVFLVMVLYGITHVYQTGSASVASGSNIFQ